MEKTAKRKLTLSKETLANLEAGKLAEVVVGGTIQAMALSERWEQTTCM